MHPFSLWHKATYAEVVPNIALFIAVQSVLQMERAAEDAKFLVIRWSANRQHKITSCTINHNNPLINLFEDAAPMTMKDKKTEGVDPP